MCNLIITFFIILLKSGDSGRLILLYKQYIKQSLTINAKYDIILYYKLNVYDKKQVYSLFSVIIVQELTMEEKKGLLVFEFLKAIIYSVSVIVVILTFLCRFAIVDGPSMNDTLKDQDVIFITNYQTFFEYIPALRLKQGDVVAVAPSQDTDNKFSVDNAFIKRVIAIEGQTIGFDTVKGEVYVDGKIIDEPYISSKTLTGVEWDIPDVIPEGKVFVMGDNRAVSVDSRSVRIQLVDKKDIIGKAQFVVYPFDRISYIYGGAL